MSRILIIGPGAVGLGTGAALTKAGHEVSFASRQAFTHLSLAKEGEAAEVFPATVITDPKGVMPFDWVMICVKAHQVASAADWLRASVGPGTKLCVMQNGVEHETRVAPFVPPEAVIVPVVVDLPTTRMAPGVVEWRLYAYLDVANNAAGQDFAGLFAGSYITVRLLDDLVTRAWHKLSFNAPTGAIMSLTGKPMRVFHEAGIKDLARGILQECILVGRAEGADLPDSLIEERLEAFMTSQPDESNSMYADRMAGRETEWDARNGVLVRLGRKHNIPTPISDTIVPLLASQTP